MRPRQIFFLWRESLLAVVIVINIFLNFSFFITSVGAGIVTCAPGEKCTFKMASANTPCGFNERHFFNDFGDSWSFEIGESKRITDKFGKFAAADNYAYTARKDGTGIYGGCVCDTASWLNYVAKINGFDSYARSQFSDPYTKPQVPDDYSVTIQVDGQGNGSNLELTNISGRPLTIKWSVDESASTVTIWVEDGEATTPPTPTPEPVNQPNQTLNLDSISLESRERATVSVSNPQGSAYLLFKILLFILISATVIAMAVSKKFREGFLLVISIIIIVGTILLIIYFIRHP